MEEDIVLMQKQDSTHRQKGQHLTSLERGKVAGFRQAGKSNRWIAADNGPEFTALNTAFAGTETEIFYAHPYTSCDRGTNEAHNRMIRQDFPKGMSLDDISPSQVQATQDRLNQLPRKQQGYCTPQQNFEAEARRVRRMAQ